MALLRLSLGSGDGRGDRTDKGLDQTAPAPPTSPSLLDPSSWEYEPFIFDLQVVCAHCLPVADVAVSVPSTGPSTAQVLTKQTADGQTDCLNATGSNRSQFLGNRTSGGKGTEDGRSP